MVVKKIIQRFLSRFGWELRKIQPLPLSGMQIGLNWIAENGIEIQTIIDVGASDGKWSLECLKSFADQQYLLLEPHPAHSAKLDQFATAHDGVVVDKRAVGAKEGNVLFNIGDLWGGAMDPEGKSEHSVEVPLVTLDASVSEHKLTGPYLIKLDTHGFEKGILDGASKILESTHALVVECYNFRIEKEALLFWEFCDYLAKKGFRPVQAVDILNRKLDGALWQMDLFFIRDSWAGFDNVKYQ